MKKNVFVFSSYLPAKRYGGPLKSVYNLVESTSDEFNYYLISQDHDFQQTEKLPGIKPGWNKVGKANVLYVNESDYSYKNILKWMKECHADIVYLCSVYYCQFNFPAVKAANTLGIPVILAPRSDLLPNCIHHKYLKKYLYLKVLRVINRYKGIWYHSTSDEETVSILKWMKTDKDHIIQLPNIASTRLDMPRTKKTKDQLHMVYVGRIHPRKNLKYAVECLVNAKGNITLDVYGAMEDEKYWKECESIASQCKDRQKLTYCGILSPLEVQQKYYQYDCLIFPTLNENYGHVIVEALIAGCPAIISKGTTPWDDYDGNGGFCCELADPDQFVKAIMALKAMNNDEYIALSKCNIEYAESHFNNNILEKQYVELFKSIIEQKKSF